MYILETERLLLREWIQEDAAHLLELNRDPEVIRYTGDGPFASEEDALALIHGYDHYEQYGMGRWAVVRREDLAFLGWCGIKFLSASEEFDVGYRFLKKYWGKGYATEAALACLEYGFKKLHLPQVVGRAMKDNLGSIRVLEKIGLLYQRPDLCAGEPGVLFALANPGYASSFPVLGTPRLRLRAPLAGDASFIYRLRALEEVNKFLNGFRHQTKQESRDHIWKVSEGNEAGVSYYWMLTLIQGVPLMGTICLWNFSPDQKTAELGYVLDPAFQKKGYMQEAVEAVLQFGFDTLQLECIRAYTHPFHEASIHLLTRHQFIQKPHVSEEELLFERWR